MITSTNSPNQMEAEQKSSSGATQDSPNDIERNGSSNTSSESFNEGDAGDGTTRAEQILHGPKLIMCIAACTLCLFLVALDTTITAALISGLGNRFHAFDKIAWITAAFLLSSGCFTQVWGKVAVVFGRKWVMIVGIIIFEIGSLVTALANSMDMLIGGRVIQGIGAAGIQTLTFMICAEVTTIDKKPIIFALLAIVFAISSVIGPLIGGAFDTYVTWRWCFYLNLCCGGAILPMFWYSFNPKTPPGSIMYKLKKIDYFDCFLSISSIVLIMLALSFGVTNYAWNSSAVISCFVLSGVLCIGFIIWNFWFSSEPIILKSTVVHPQLMAAIFSLSFGFSTLYVLVQFLSVYFQVIKGYNSIHTGMSLFPIIIPSSLFSIISAIVLKKTRQIKPFAVLSGVCLVVGAGMLTLLKVDESLSRRVGLLLIAGVGTGLVMQCGVISVQILAPKEPSGLLLSTAFMNFIRNVFGAVFSEVGQVIYTETLKSNVKAIAGKVSTRENLLTLATETSLLSTLDESDTYIVKSAVLKSIHNTFYFAIGLSALSLISSILMSNKKLPKLVENN